MTRRVPVSEAPNGGRAVRKVGPKRQWLLVFLGFFLVFGAWAFAAPYDGPADEVQHVIRAVGVVSGQIAPAPAVVKDYQGFDGMGAYQRVPEGLFSHGFCWGFKRDTSAACATPIHGGPVRAEPTTAGRYQPVYYALVGLPLKLSPTWTGLVLARLVSAALSAALLAFAFVVLVRWSRFGLMLAGLIAVSTPMLAHMAGAVNPNGLEIAAGIALFSAGIPLLLGPRRGSIAPLVWLLGVSAALLATLRSLGPMWLFFALAALLVPQSRATLRRLWSHRLVRGWTAVAVVATLLSVGWVVVMKAGAIISVPGKWHYSTLEATLKYVNFWGREYLWGLVGVAGWFDVVLPAPFYVAWTALAGALIVFALVVGTWTDRWRFFVIFVGGIVVPGVMQVREANAVGFIIGGRYMLPLLAGMPLLAAFILERRLLNARQSASMIKLFAVTMLPAQFVLLVYAMARWQAGLGDTHANPLVGNWHPPTTSYPPLVLMPAGLALLAWILWTAPRRVTYGPDLADEQAADAGVDGNGAGHAAGFELEELLARPSGPDTAAPAPDPKANGDKRARRNGAAVTGLAEGSPK
jgi:Predicted membrane protein (DUF2142)